MVELILPGVFFKIKFVICKTDGGTIPDHETSLNWFKVNKVWQKALIKFNLRASTPHKDGCYPSQLVYRNTDSYYRLTRFFSYSSRLLMHHKTH